MTLHYNTICQNEKNAVYPHKSTINSIVDLETVVSYDHVCAEYKDGYRKNSNFIQSNCSMFDVDNTETDNPDEWITPEHVREAFPDVPFYVSYSRNHMKQKGDKAPRPKFHLYFPDTVFTDSQEYSKHKKSVCNYFKKFDQNAKDAARFFFGVPNPKVEFYDGNMLLFDFMQTVSVSEETNQKSTDTEIKLDNIPEGQRNATMHQYALKVLTRYGADDGTAYQAFRNESQRCSPPLDNSELNQIWNGAVAYYNSDIKINADYVPPELYNLGVMNINFELPIVDYNELLKLCKVKKKKRIFNIDVCRMFLKTFGISIRYNDMSHDYEITAPTTVINGENRFELLATILEDTIIKLAYKRGRKAVIYGILDVIANENRYHPVIDLLKKEPWDNADRLTDLYHIMGISDEFHKVLVRKWLLQTIAILFNSNDKPISSQGILVLQGGQGIGKTEFLRHLAIKNEFFKGGSVLDMKNKDTIISATRVWICELGEIDSTTSKKQSELKAFITEQYDRYREPYARKEVKRLRKTSFCGTVNPTAYLTDETGNRRFWTIPVQSIDLNKVFSSDFEWYTQLWRQIYSEYKQNPMGYLLTNEEQNTLNRSNEKYETLLQGEDEFMTVFDTSADYSLWTNRLTAAQIADELNSRFKSLHISSMSVGKNLIPRIEKRTSKQFERKTIRGRNFILCPPFAEDKTYETPILPDYPATDKT
ncbi:VapE domain-containing protein [uncultured Ruminococcus sp.]|uniref:VapE domain-containing protein n=1 Tax=uncultured Ruminococcus sp. TaxID=165186 RepID=UPI0026DAD759|nr:VapE domain-containing protein [uncultured Ruminococcus sp.]